MEEQKWNEKTRNMVLALYVLSGVLTEVQLKKLIDEDYPVPDTWEGIIAFINEFKENKQ